MNKARGTSEESTASFPLKNFPVKTRKIEKIKPESIAVSIGNIQINSKHKYSRKK